MARISPRRFFAVMAAAAALFAVRVLLLPVGDALPLHAPLQGDHYDYKGIIHWHTQYSGDATGTFEDVARATNQQGIDFMISTDHNTLQPLVDGKERWRGNTLFLTGVEITRPEGYILALNVRHFITDRAEKTSKVIADIFQQGGFIVLAHPEHPRNHWRGPEPDVQAREVLDCADQLMTTPWPSLLLGALYYPFNTPAAWLQLYHRPDKAIAEWDAKTAQAPQVGIYASDFHQAIEVTHAFKIPFPKVDSVTPIMHDHIVMKEPFSADFARDKQSVYDALARGHLYFSLDLVQDATGFFFSAKQGDRAAWMGDSLPAGAETTFTVKLPAHIRLGNPRIVAYRNGVEIGAASASDYTFTAHEPGAYRIEVEADVPTFWGGSRTVTWIYSNPVYLARKQ